MILYSIRRKSDGKFFSMWYRGYNHEGHWGNSPTFWKKSETIWAHLKKMCSLLKAEKRFVKSTYNSAYDYNYILREWHSFDSSKLSAYEIIETNVNVLGEKRISAENFVNPAQMCEVA